MSAIIKIKALQNQWETDDPFLFCAFHKDNFPEGNENLGPKASLAGRPIGQDFIQKDGWAMYHGSKVPGFPAHPHLGFETVTIAERGYVDHSDSLGASGRFGQGDIQWMTAGKGVQHSEMFPLLKQDQPNPLLLFQIWLNLPAKSKQVEPYFGMFWNENVPITTQTDAKGKTSSIKIIAGTYDDKTGLRPNPDSWAAREENKVNIWLIEIDKQAEFTLPATTGDVKRSLYFYEGDTLIAEDFEIPAMHRIILNPEQEFKLKNSDTTARLLLLEGKPINEPVVQHDPFVANSRDEINQAFARFRNDEFGGWPWPSNEHTHDPKKGRFAIFPDGKEEVPR